GLSEVNFNTWIKNLIIKKQEDKIIIATENDFVKNIVVKKYQAYIIKAIRDLKIKYTVLEYMLIK
ncbi:MAG: DnaA N-terminal domain-containing protein, partial [Sarcina sp.]